MSRVTVLKSSKRSLMPTVRPASDCLSRSPATRVHRLSSFSDRVARSRTTCKSRSNVVSRLTDLVSRLVCTGRSSMPSAAWRSQPVYRSPNCVRSMAGSARASSPMVTMPKASSLAVAFGPMPLIFFAGKGHTRVSISSGDKMVRPSGFSRSEQIFASNLFGARPIEHDRPVAPDTAAFRHAAMAGACSPYSVRSI